MYICKYCGQERKNANSLRNHERFCKENPERQSSPFMDGKQDGHKGRNQFLKAREQGLPVPVVSEQTRKLISINSSIGLKKFWDGNEEAKKRQSEHAKKRNLGGVRQSKWIHYKDAILGSSYELKVVLELEDNNIEWKTCKRFNYIDPFGKARTYTPDLYLPEYDVYLDPKNDFLIEHGNPRFGFSDVVKIKRVCEQNNIRVVILNKEELTWDVIKTKIS